jgi:hypothetical protein
MFKPGERVRCLRNFFDEFTKGKIYIVKEMLDSNQIVFLKKDDKGFTNGLQTESFESVEKEYFYKELLEDIDEIPF